MKVSSDTMMKSTQLIRGSWTLKRSCQLYLRMMHQNFWPAYFAVVYVFFSAASKALTEFRKSLIDLQEERE
jgi:heme A synthase